MKIIVCSDTHYDVSDREIKRNEDVDKTFGEVIENAIENEVDIFVHCGDVFDNNRPTTDAIAMLIRQLNKLEEAEIKTFILVGNHDIISQNGRTSALEPIKAINYKYIKVVEKPEVKKFKNGVTLLFMPHIAKAHLGGEDLLMGLQDFWEYKIKELLKKSTDTVIGFAHHNIEGATSGSEAWMVKGDEQILPKSIFENRKIKMIFDGHIHKPQILKKKSCKVVVVGSVECLNMGEKDEDKKFAILEVGNEES